MDISAAPLRALRAALFTALCVTLSATGHVLLSRVPLPLPLVAALSVGVFAVAYVLAGRERGFGCVAALLVPLELAADAVFDAGQLACYGPAGGPVTGPLRSLGVEVLCNTGNVGTPLAPVPGQPQAPAATWLLLLAHIAVGLLAALWLRRGEAAVARLAGAVTAFAFRPLLLAVAVVRALLVPRRPEFRPVWTEPVARAVPLLVHCVVRRGPPCSLAA
ncbi:hypothetical protein ACFXN2_08525 [Streptomyces kronopolitis]|uniref:hypothetical protein n=1 Tax=Streptomyces kronopolitis TaxID=1612435 RepID=UPI0020BDC8D5|nr:hypothetical protein [Streptomyces kronopolitis]MCL6298901.1 hypothetical protein [Streptomyces kronopolitis]